MMFVEEGKIKLSDPITKYLTEGKDKWGGVTMKHLLTHTSGMPTCFMGAWTCARTIPRMIS